MLKTVVKMVHGFRIFFLIYIIAGSLIISGVNPVDLGKFIGAKVGSAVGMSVSVPENPFSKLALELREKENELAQRERTLDARERTLDVSGGFNAITLILIAGIGVLFALIVLNYYFDYKRRKKEEAELKKLKQSGK